MRTTLKRETTLVGMGLHSGRPVRLALRPVRSGGIRFRRVDVTDRDNVIPARFDLVSDTTLCTQLTNHQGVTVATVEHLMAALAGTGVTDVLIDIDGPEVPIMDGSARRFVQSILRAGRAGVVGPLKAIRVLKPVREEHGAAFAELLPAPVLSIDFEIEFPDQAIGRQHKVLAMPNGVFLRELSDSRTFCRRVDVEAMQANGLALGGSLDNAVVVEGDRVLNPGGLRRSDEFVRHKMLDLTGDLSLLGRPLRGHVIAYRAGHDLHARLARAIAEAKDAWYLAPWTEPSVESPSP